MQGDCVLGRLPKGGEKAIPGTKPESSVESKSRATPYYPTEFWPTPLFAVQSPLKKPGEPKLSAPRGPSGALTSEGPPDSNSSDERKAASG